MRTRARVSLQARGWAPGPIATGTGLQALRPIQSISDTPPFQIIPVCHAEGTAMSAEDLMAARVKWADKAGYVVLTRDVAREHAPYNAVIRLNATGTEDRDRDYLAYIVDDVAPE